MLLLLYFRVISEGTEVIHVKSVIYGTQRGFKRIQAEPELPSKPN